MRNNGFIIDSLSIVGPSVEPAEIDFDPGLNVIGGLSNTGKTYILTCINHLLGSSTPPKDVDESRGYTTGYLQIRTLRGTVYTIERVLGGGDVRLYSGSYNEPRTEIAVIKAEKRSSDGSDLSSWLLDICGFAPSKIRKNKRGETNDLSFRMIMPLISAFEANIISDASPIRPVTSRNESRENWTFHFVLTGRDDSSLIVAPDPKITKTQNDAKREVFSGFISQFEQRLAEIRSAKSQFGNAESIDGLLQVTSENMLRISESIADLQKQRQELWAQRRALESRALVIDGLMTRFDLLKKHYESDLRRLDFVSEGQFYYDELQSVACSLCGMSLEDGDHEHTYKRNLMLSFDIQNACAVEATKIRGLMNELESTINTLIYERSDVWQNVGQLTDAIQLLDLRLENELRPAAVASRAEYDQLIAFRALLAEEEVVVESLARFFAGRDNLVDKRTISVPQTKDLLDRVALRHFCDNVYQVLEGWNFPDLGPVEFEERKMDVIIGGRRRANNGKGILALTHSAFKIALMQYCVERELPHPKIVLLDSPLTTLKEREKVNFRDTSDEDVSGDIHNAFFEKLSGIGTGCQVLIFENKRPPIEIEEKIKFHWFSKGTTSGRYGFFPLI